MLEEVVSSKTLRVITIVTTIVGFGLLVGGVLTTAPTYEITYTDSSQDISTEVANTQASVLTYQELSQAEQEAVTQAIETGNSEIDPETISPLNTTLYINQPDSSGYAVLTLSVKQGSLPVYVFIGILLLFLGLISGLGYSLVSEAETAENYQQRGIRPARPDEEWQYKVIDDEDTEDSSPRKP